MSYRRKFTPSRSKAREFAIKMKEIEEFCNQNAIQMSYNQDSYYFRLYGQEYRVSNHTIEKSNEHAFNYFGEQVREMYHPDGRKDDVVYIHASKTRIMEIYNDIKEGYMLNGRGYRISDTNYAKSIMEKTIAVFEEYRMFELPNQEVGIINLELSNLSQEDLQKIINKNRLNELDGFEYYYVFDTYYEALLDWRASIEKDLHDLGIFNDNGEYNFYLNEDEISYLGFGKELEEQRSEIQEEIENDEEVMC